MAASRVPEGVTMAVTVNDDFSLPPCPLLEEPEAAENLVGKGQTSLPQPACSNLSQKESSVLVGLVIAMDWSETVFT